MNKKFIIIGLAGVAAFALIATVLFMTLDPAKPVAQAVPAPPQATATSTAVPTAPPEPTATPTMTPSPTATATPQPTATPRPTPTPLPTPTPKPDFNTLFQYEVGDKVRQINPGLIQIRREIKGPMKINILLFDLTAPQLDLRVVAPDDTLGRVARTSAMAKSNKAIAGVNGDEFSYGGGLPQGMMISDGRLMISPKHRATFGWTKDRQPFIGYFTQDWTWPSEIVAANGSRHSLQLLNTPCDGNALCIYNEYYGTVPARAGDFRVLLDENQQVIQIKEEGALKILPGQTVLVGLGQSRTWLKANVAVGNQMQIRLVTTPDYRKFDQAVSGGPVILQQGQFVQDCLCNLRDCTGVPQQYKGPLCEEFPLDWKYTHYLTVRMPRIGIGYNADKTTLILVSVDGYQPGWSIGMTQKELADLMLEFGAYDAMELDGGGSATMVLEDKLISRPSDGGGVVERSVANSLLFFWNNTPTSNNRTGAR